jgi:hypothetical protein
MNGQDASYHNVHIVKTVPGVLPMIQRWIAGRLETALNWRELSEEATRAIEPEARQRWRAYWESCKTQAAVANDAAATLDEMMKCVPFPSSYYPCPPQLAARALWPTGTSIGPDTLHVIEGATAAPAQREIAPPHQ